MLGYLAVSIVACVVVVLMHVVYSDGLKRVTTLLTQEQDRTRHLLDMLASQRAPQEFYATRTEDIPDPNANRRYVSDDTGLVGWWEDVPLEI